MFSFSREKIRKFLTGNSEAFTKNTINNINDNVMNEQNRNFNSFPKKLNISAEKSLKIVPTGKWDNNDIDITTKNSVISDKKLITGDYYSDDNNMIVGGFPTLRKSKTPIENINLHDFDYSFIKKNKTHTTEEGDNKENEIVNNSADDTFHRAVAPFLFLGQCFALMPVTGVLNPNPKRLRFSYKSIQIMVFLVFITSSSILTLTMFKFLLKIGINAKNFVGFVFFSCVQCSSLLFVSLAPRWPKIMRYFARVELIFVQKPYEIPKRRLAKRIRYSALLIIFGMAVEHGLYLASAILSYKRSIELCASYRNYTEEVSFEDYIRRNYNYVFEMLPYNFSVGCFILIINGSCTFIWNYMDLFIMMVSKGLAYRFEQITTRINKLANKEIPETVFIEIREHYVKLCELLEFIDENLSGIILLSCMNNLYFVCYQLLNIFNKLRWPINYIYFWYSLLYLIGRTAFVFLSAAAINDESKGGLALLRKVSSRTWCVEVERLIFQMTTQTVALSGKKFYFLTRRLLFGMAGTIVTYELVLLQFDEPNRAKGLSNLCD